MPRDGAITFADLIGKLDMLHVACEKCDRKGRYAVARLIEQRGRDTKVLDLPASGQIIYGMAYGRPAGADLLVSVRTVHLRISAQRPRMLTMSGQCMSIKPCFKATSARFISTGAING